MESTLYTYKQQTWSKLPGEFRGVRPMTEKRFLQLGGKIKRDNKERNAVNMDMTVHDVNGNEVHISKDEAERIAAELAKLNHSETNDQFLNRALDNIQDITGFRPKSEEELKELLYRSIQGPTRRDIELLYEAMETIAGWHKKKVG